MTATAPACHTYVYKSVLGVDYHLDCYLPEKAALETHRRARAPVLMYWHGGGLCAGTRALDGLVPTWLLGECAGGVETSRERTPS